MPDPNPNAETGISSPQALVEKQLSTFTDHMVTTMERISKVAEKGPVVLLTTLGAGLIVGAIMLKVQLNGHAISNITAGEFISMMVAATILLLAGSLLRLYQYKSSLDTIREQQKVGAELLTRTSQAGANLVGQSTAGSTALPPM